MAADQQMLFPRVSSVMTQLSSSPRVYPLSPALPPVMTEMPAVPGATCPGDSGDQVHRMFIAQNTHGKLIGQTLKRSKFKSTLEGDPGRPPTMQTCFLHLILVTFKK